MATECCDITTFKSVCEGGFVLALERALSCRYSVFVSASLLISFFTLTASLLRALKWVRNLAECTEENSQCYEKVQRWFFKRLVKGLVPVDLDALELQFAEACETFRGNTTIFSEFQDNLPAFEPAFATEVRRMSCDA
jgi:hypothetical protein